MKPCENNYLNSKNIFNPLFTLSLIFICILLIQMQIFSQESRNHYLTKYKLIQDSQIPELKQAGKSVFPLRNEQSDPFRNQNIHFRQPAKTSDYYQNTEVLEERWDSTGWYKYQKFLYSYNIDGHQTAKKIQNWKDSEWVDTLLYSTDYLDFDYIYTYQFWDGSNWINNYRYTYFYDISWNYIGSLWELGDSLNWINNQKGICYWNTASGKIDSTITLNWKTNKWENYQKEINYYNYKEEDSLQLILYWHDSIWVERFQRMYTLDTATPSFNYVFQQWDGFKWTNQYRYSSFYTPEYLYIGNMDERWNDSAQTWMLDYKYTNSYNASNQAIEYLYQESSDGLTWNNGWHYTYEYDTSGMRTKELFQEWETGWENSFQYLYEYDANGNESRETYQRWNGARWINEYRDTFTWEYIVGVKEPVFVNKFRLFNNYPNPFNPSTHIKYSIGSRQHVTLKVYDLLGREVATLVNEEKPAGEYNVRFEARNSANGTCLSSGVYFYRIQAGMFTDTKKFIFLK